MPLNGELTNLDMTKVRPTELKQNRRLIMPDARSAEEELALQSRKNFWRKATVDYMARNCDERGTQMESNVSPALSRGIKKLRKRTELETAVDWLNP